MGWGANNSLPLISMIKIGRVTLDSVTWTPIRPPSDCYNLRIYNPNAVVAKFRTDDADANSEYPIDSLTEFPVRGTRNAHLQAGTIVGYGQLATGTNPVVLIAEN